MSNILKNIIKQDISEQALADKLKNVCSEVFHVKRECFDLQSLKEVYFETPLILSLDKIMLILKKFNIPLTEDLVQKFLKLEGTPLKSPRHMAQMIGTEVLRATGDQDIHCRNIVLNNKITVVSDIRFPNEFAYFNDLADVDFLPLYIQRNEAENKITPESHSSETSIFAFCDKCILINNNNSLDDLKDQLKQELKRHNL